MFSLLLALDINSDVILGNDFLKRFEISLDYSDMTAVLSSKNVSVEVPRVSKAFDTRDIIANLSKM